jgi:diaminopimelate epimerase
MHIEFDKYQGAGNDFIILDNRDRKFSNLSKNQLKFLCNRQKGIGADGIILVENAEDADFNMHYFNSDGSLSSLCGNGGRCSVAFASKHNIIGTKTKFKAIDGLHEAELLSSKEVRLNIQDVSTIIKHDDSFFVNTGSPHYVKLVESVSSINVKKEGALIRYSNFFKPNGVNVNFLEKRKNNHFLIRTYERGVENETLACGTGAVAGALVMSHIGETGDINKILLEALGGKLNVGFKKNNNEYKNVYLQGPATFVYSGIVVI